MKVEDLKVYKMLFKLSLQVYNITLEFPKFEMYELGSQLRRSSNSVPANVAEGFNNKHTNIYLECISRSHGELRETIHHLKIAYCKGYIKEDKLKVLVNNYRGCSKMLYGLERSLKARRK